jgi:NAD(P)-dependent dehydrogenase (short-subunit alcohol dehydrogenase family)
VALAAAGATVVVVARGQTRIAETLRELELRTGSGHHLGMSLDVRCERDMEKMAGQTIERFGHIDILVASAGIGRSARCHRLVPAPIVQLPTEEWTEVLDTNLTGTFLSNRAVLPSMIDQGSGEIVNVVSARGGLAGQPYAAAYCASKFGLVGLSQALAEEVRSHGVRVQLLFPDAIDTPLLAGTPLAPCRLPAERVANFIAYMIAMPDDCVLESPIIAPFDA